MKKEVPTQRPTISSYLLLLRRKTRTLIYHLPTVSYPKFVAFEHVTKCSAKEDESLSEENVEECQNVTKKRLAAAAASIFPRGRPRCFFSRLCGRGALTMMCHASPL